MKKIIFTLALALGLGLTASAQESGLFGYGPSRGEEADHYTSTRSGMLALPSSHGGSGDVDGAPLGTGTALLLGLGAAYLVSKKRKNQNKHNAKFFLMAAVLTAGLISANIVAVGQNTTTFTAGSGTNGAYSSGATLSCSSGGWTWVTSAASNGFESSSPNRGIQYTQSTNITHTETGATITKVVVTASTNKTNNTVNVKVGTGYTGTASSMTSGTANETHTFDNINTTGEIKVILTKNASSGSVYIKSIQVYYSTGPSTSVSTSSLTGFTYAHGTTPTQTQSFKINGANLTNNITVSLNNANFLMSESENGSYSTDDIEVSKGNGTVTDKYIYVRQASGLGINNEYTGTITVSSTSVSTDKTVGLSGSVTGYTVTYNANGSTDGTVPTDNTAYEMSQTVTVKPNSGSLAKTHFTFGGWNTKADGTGTNYEAGTGTFNITANTTLYAKWVPITHQFNTATATSNNTYPVSSSTVVAKDSGNNTIASGNQVAETAQLTLTATPESGFVFGSWSDGGNNATLSSTSTNPTTFTMGSADVTITATFIPTHTFTYSVNNNEYGSVGVNPNVATGSAVAEGRTFTVTATPTNASYKFKQWNVTGEGSSVTSTTEASTTFTMGTVDATLQAVFAPVYTVTYAANGGSGTMTDQYSPYFVNTEVTLLDNAFTYTGHTFNHWTAKDASDNDVIITNGKITMPASNVTVTANWTTNTHDVTMPSNDTYGEYGTSASTAVPYDTEVTLTYTPAEGYGNYVAVWSVNGTAIVGNTFNMPDADVTVTVAPHATYTVTYDANGGEGTVTDNTVYDDGVSVTAKPNSFTYDGHTFTGWNTQADGNGTAVAAGATFTITGYTTLYAQWFDGYIYDFSTVNNFYTESGGSTHPGTGSSNKIEDVYYGNGHLFSADGTGYFNSGYFLLSNGSKLALPAFDDYYITKVVLHSSSGCSQYVSVSIIGMDGTTERTVSNSQTWSTKDADYSYDIAYVYQHLPLSIKVTNSYNVQFTRVTLYLEPATSDPVVAVTPALQTVSHTAQTIASGKPLGFGVFSRNIESPTYLLAYCDENGEVLGSNPYDWFSASINNTVDSITYSVQAQAVLAEDRTAYFKAYTMVNSEPVYSGLISVMQKHYPATYTLVSSNADIVKGSRYIIASGTSGTVYVMGEQSNESYRAAIQTSASNNQITETDGMYEFVISGSGSDTEPYTLFDVAYNGFLSTSGGSSANITIQKPEDLDSNGKWSITFSSNVASITAKSNNSHKYIKFNSSANPKRFACYSSTSCSVVYLYKINEEHHTDYDFYSNATLASATIESGKTYTVHSPAVLNVTTLTNNGSLIIEDGAQLITSSTGVQATVNKSVAHSNAKDADNWFTISSPVNNPAFASVTNLIQDPAENYDLYRYNEASHMWENKKAHTTDFTNLENGRGYLYWNEPGEELSFSGVLNVADVECSLTKTGSGDIAGFNLIGNPFPHNIYKGTGGAINDSKLADGFYVLNNASGWSAKLDYQTAIVPGQGILVQTTEDIELTITNTNAAATAEKRSSNDLITFNVANDRYEDVAYVQFKDAAGLNKIEHINAEIPMLYVHQNNADYAIANMDRDVVSFDLNFVAATAGEYTINAKAEGEFEYFHLIDRIAGKDIDMLNEGKYTFTAQTDDLKYRFHVKLNEKANHSQVWSDNFAFISDGQIIFNGVSNDATLQVIDMLGRVVISRNGVQTIATSEMTSGIYVLRLIDGANVMTQKIVVK